MKGAYLADIQNASMYYPFGSLQPGRNYTTGNDYAYGFNGKLEDDEIKGEGNSLDFGARIYYPRIGRWLSIDPKADIQPSWSTYKAFLDNPIVYTDPEGETEYFTLIIDDEKTGKKMAFTVVFSDEVFPSSNVNMVDNKYGGGYYNSRLWYDKQTILSVKADQNGNYTLSSTDTRLVGNPKASTSGPLMNSSWWANFQASANLKLQKGGWYLTSETGGLDQTEFIALSDAEQKEVGKILAAFGAMGKSPDIPKNVDVTDVVKKALSFTKQGMKMYDGGGESEEQEKMIEMTIYKHESRTFWTGEAGTVVSKSDTSVKASDTSAVKKKGGVVKR